MRCLIIVPSLTRAGAETQAVDLANGLSSRGHVVHLCSFGPQLDQMERLSTAVNFHHLLRRGKIDWSLVTAIAKIIDGERIEVVQGILQFAVLKAWLAVRQTALKPPVVAGVHTTINRGFKQELQDQLIYRWILRRCAAVVFVCEHQRNYWTSKFPELRPLGQVVYNGVDVSRFCRDEFVGQAHKFRAELCIPRSAVVFACVAAFRPEKGHSLLIDAFSKVANDAHLVLAGDGVERPVIEKAVAATAFANKVHFVGSVADVRPVIVASNATVLSSTAVETFSMAMLESMALEVPVIAPRIGGLAEAIADGESGLLFPIADSTALATAMLRMISSSGEVRCMGTAAASKVRSAFTLEKMIEGSEAVLANAIAAQTRG